MRLQLAYGKRRATQRQIAYIEELMRSLAYDDDDIDVVLRDLDFDRARQLIESLEDELDFYVPI